MSSLVLTNKSILEMLLTLIAQFGLPWFVALIIILFVLGITYLVLKKRNLIGNPDPKIDLSPILSKLNNLSNDIKTNNQILLEVCGKILEKQESSLTNEQATIINDSILDSLITHILKITMDIYISEDILCNEQSVKNILLSEIEASIRDNDRIIEFLPNIKDLLIPTKNKIEAMEDKMNSIIEILKTEKDEREAARKFKSIYITTIKNSWML